MPMFNRYMQALWESWEGKMSGVVSLCLLGAGAFSGYFSGELGAVHLRGYLWTASVLAFGFANWRAWLKQAKQILELEKNVQELKKTAADQRADLLLFLSYNLWRFDPALNKTLCFILAKVINRGHPSIISGWSGKYILGESSEMMTSFHLLSPYQMRLGEAEITLTNSDLLPSKTHEFQIPKGGSVTGRILVTLEGDRTTQFEGSQFQIEIECFDYLGTRFSSRYCPEPKTTPNLMFSASEKVVPVSTPPAL